MAISSPGIGSNLDVNGIVSVGAGNRYGLQDAEVEARYEALGACVLRTDRCGAVTVTRSRAELSIACRTSWMRVLRAMEASGGVGPTASPAGR